MKPIGILGGGQLARLLVLDAHRMHLPVAVLSPSETDPAREVCGHWTKGDPTKLSDLVAFMKGCSSVTFESELYDAAVIEQASAQTKVPVSPKPSLMALLQDRLTQKNLFDQYEIPTAAWRPVDSSQDALVAYVAFDGKVVYKKRRGGYDGYGTFVVKNDQQLGDFANTGVNGSFIAEKLIRFQREIAIIAVRDQAGAVFFYPYVESHQKDSRCLWIQGPLRETKSHVEMKKKLAMFLKGIDYVGAMGIEMFDTDQGLIVNEIAPRVHNTGHYTSDAFSLSQFALHLRAVAGLRTQGFAVPLVKAFAMWNLLGTGEGRLTPWLTKTVSKAKDSEARTHWYGKHNSRAGRKMGHINALAKTSAQALALAKATAARAKKEIGF